MDHPTTGGTPLLPGTRCAVNGQLGTVLQAGVPFPDDVHVRLDGETRTDIWQRSQVAAVQS